MTRGLDRAQAVELLKSHHGLSDAITVPTAQAAIRDRQWRAGDTVLRYAAEILMQNRRLRALRHSYNEQELKNMAIANFPRALKHIAAPTLEDDNSFLEWCQALARIVEISKIDLTPKSTALLSHARHQTHNGKDAPARPRAPKDDKCYRCKEPGHKAATCTRSWADIEHLHKKSGGETATVAATEGGGTPATTGHAFAATGDAAVADNGASRHIVGSADGLFNVKHFDGTDAPRVRVAGGTSVAATAEGDKHITVLTSQNDTHTLLLRRCLLLPNGMDLVSIDRILALNLACVPTVITPKGNPSRHWLRRAGRGRPRGGL
jgi:hypothetical protein